MRTGDTITALATGPITPGTASSTTATHALIRLSGPASISAFEPLFSASTPPTHTKRSCSRVILNLCLDHATDRAPSSLPAQLMVYPHGQSFTGELSAELILPSNRTLVKRIIDRLCAHADVRPAEPGEFSARAYLAGRLSLSQAEGIAALIAANTQDQWQAARQLTSGQAGELHQSWADDLANLLALTEAGIDFTDQEDVVAITPEALRDRLHALRAAMNAAAPSLVRTGAVRVALVGPPNAGKSTLFNALLGIARTITSEQAGTTRDAISEPMDLRPLTAMPVELIDLPGLDASLADPIGIESQRCAREVLAHADVFIVCAPDLNADIDTLLEDRAGSIIRVRTKADRPGPLSADAIPVCAIPVCAIDHFGLADLRSAIAHRVNELTSTSASSAAGVAPRHAAALRDTAEYLLCALDHLHQSEVLASDLRSALDAMSPLVGRIEPDQVLGLVFSTFCVGK